MPVETVDSGDSIAGQEPVLQLYRYDALLEQPVRRPTVPGRLCRASRGEIAQRSRQQRMPFEPRALFGDGSDRKAQRSTRRRQRRQHLPSRPADRVDEPRMQLVEDCGVEQHVARLRPDPVQPRPDGGLGALGSQPGENVAGPVRPALECGRAERGRPAVAKGDDLLGDAGVEIGHQDAE